MQIETIVLIIGAFIIAWAVALYQYIYRIGNKSKRNFFFSFLRFISIFALLLLLINPSFKKKSFEIIKPTLVVAADNSSSIQYLNKDKEVFGWIEQFRDNSELNDRFDLAYYGFGEGLSDSLSLSFDQKQTNISGALENLDQIYKNTNALTVLISDGNQTYGRDYQFVNSKYKQEVFPVVVGDTTAVTDTKIEQLNVNRYAYLKNKFPIEVILTYSGKEDVNSRFEIKSGNNVIYTMPVTLSDKENSKILNFTLPANRVGVLQYKAVLQPLENEKNKVNNQKDFAVEVIDQKTNVLLISSLVHPDLGALKKSVESNERRKLEIKKPWEVTNLNDYQLIILYQPDTRFRAVFEKLNTEKKNYFTITGAHTDWVFLNQVQSTYRQEITRQTEYYLPRFNTNYSTFLVDDFGFGNYPPLIGTFGDIRMNTSHDILLYRTIGNVSTDDPLLATIEENGRREAVLFGEGFWQWRARSFLDDKSFESIDDLIGKLIQYLASNKRKSRLNTTSESFYYGNSSIRIKAEYFTKNYEFDRRGNLKIAVKNTDTKAVQTIPMLLKNNTYEADLSNLTAGNYEYTVSVTGENLSRSGSFSILNYNVEQQLSNADVTKLRRLASNTNGRIYFKGQQDTLIQDLLKDERYQPVQKSKEKVVSLIDWKILLAIIILVLSTEWFVRKYNGLI